MSERRVSRLSHVIVYPYAKDVHRLHEARLTRTSIAQLSYSGNATLYDYRDTTADGKMEGQSSSR